ncbi:acetylglucosaminylphosphatidylinositol deacetylase [Pseudomonas rhizosphaerae]|jgi:LmbE family N-acetylglucosaminyl deacetylase|uniref:Acetylglucosaminylphosphatidylinositol deacetylase n=1 Tax=Pseudomonas rhizosphaerae TaxID=216142 RepID=A0A089ZQN4_9PSED|nr:PIG-L family deacetylase [Pseudomonas rhizosphaerae]AIS17936.1 acetylglucosaminylphosphatidylinositol deacetylase [Pseudomonas rhizosphaerae]
MKENPIVGQGTPLQAWRGSRRLAELPLIEAQTLVPTGSRAVIIAPHPDDEVLGCGGLLQLLAGLDRQILIISVTDGSASHPGSQTWPAERLSAVRPQESAEALHRLGLPLHSLQWIRGGFADSGVANQEHRLTEFIQRYLKPTDVVFSTWSNDGHTDHEAVGRAGASAAAAAGATHHELPIWTWHWATPEDDRIPWERARKLPLDKAMVARKSHAVHAFASQLEGDPQIGLAPVLPPYVLERLLQPFEVVFL